MTRLWRDCCCLLLFGVSLVFCSSSQGLAVSLDIRLQTVLDRAAPAEEVPVIVTFRDRVDLATLWQGPLKARRAELIRTLKGRAESAQQPVRALLRSRGVGRVQELWIINGLAMDAAPEVIRELAARPEVGSVRLQEVVRVPRVVPAQITGPAEANIDLVNAPEVWAQGFAGQGVTVAIMDSGVDIQHPDLGSRWRAGNNSWYDPNGEHPLGPVDMAGHGTAVMGVLVGGNADGTFIGVAPEAQWIAVKIFNDAGVASEAVIHQGFQWLLDPDGNPATDDAPDVVNNSWGFADDAGVCDAVVQIFKPDVQTLKAAGIAVVFSAGNTGPNSNTSIAPANYSEAFAVGSIGTFESPTDLSDFSARGPSACDGTIYPEVVAPGFFVKTADLTLGGLFPDSYVFATGNSFSSPQVAGVMALLLSAHPNLTVSQLEQVVLDTAVDLGVAGPDNLYGYGMVDALAAFDQLSSPPRLEILDDVPPADDRTVDFGGILVGASVNQVVTLKNSGGGYLGITGLDPSALTTSFTVESDQCSGALLAAAETCTIRIGFTPQAFVEFQGSFLISSNDVQSPAQVSFVGQGVAQALPPKLVISDDTGASNDAAVVFEQVPPGTSAFATVTVSNAAATGPLQILGLSTTSLPAPFSVATDLCSNRTLLAGQSCTIQVRFVPQSAVSFNGSFHVLSNDAASPHLIEVRGSSNTQPPPAVLQSPVDGAGRQPTSLTLTWLQQPDADGDAVSNTVQLSADPHFLNPLVVASAPGPGSGWLSGALGLAVCLLPLGLLGGRKGRSLLLTACLGMGLLVLISCGGGGGGGSDDENTVLRSESVSNLLAGTTYYWRVLSQDARGGTSVSTTFSFTTAP